MTAEWLANGRQLPTESDSERRDITVSELIAAYWRHAEAYYVKDGKPTSELSLIKLAMRPLRKLYGRTPTSEFGPLALKTVRRAMVAHDACRSTVNGYVARIKRMFRWAVENELIPPAVHQGLHAVTGLRRGRTEARDEEPVKPVPDRFVDVIHPHVARQVWAMVELQWLTGMRPGEVTIMRVMDIDTTGEIWQYRPASHKTEHHGHGRIVDLGPKAQNVVRPFLKADMEAHLFSPAEAEAERHADLRRCRKTPVQPSQRNRRKRKAKCRPKDHYTVASYRRAIQRGCDKADAAVKEAKGPPHDGERLVPRWHPHQLRHNFASRIRREHGLEAARVLLGHRSMAVTEVYAEIDRAKVAEVVARTG